VLARAGIIFQYDILKDIYSDLGLASYLGFKDGTTLMLFHDLPRLYREFPIER
jgi:hypothetical protein